uniref:Antifreeze protein n=1 Tax=Strombidinopsis acuminata TaxID=141414 RepID=A0A7S3T2P4_9SPIT|mmetsp:Transcript_4964/g.15101  ORF Transcript_4964/g.15101 Transcript_4964/m.15101 type:complete len:146 (-) Transcript_4964:146-583(-)|eukprot:scaffold191014_cov26-Tisochrysis_lutea.AAC.1
MAVMRHIALYALLVPVAGLSLGSRPVQPVANDVVRQSLLGTAAAAVVAMSSLPVKAATVSFGVPDLPSFSMPSFSAPSTTSPSQTDADKASAQAAKAAEKAARQAEFRRVRAERMAAEARAQSEEYAKVMAGVGTQSFGSTTTVR